MLFFILLYNFIIQLFYYIIIYYTINIVLLYTNKMYRMYKMLPILEYPHYYSGIIGILILTSGNVLNCNSIDC